MADDAEFFRRAAKGESRPSASVAAASFPANEPVTIDDCASEYLLYIESVRSLSKNCVTAYREDLSHLSVMLGGSMPLADVSPADLRMCIAEMSRRKYSAASINRFIAAVRGLFAYCRKFRYIPANPALSLRTVRMPKQLPRYMTSGEVDELCAAPGKKELLWAARDTALFEMLYSSGCRVGEIAALSFGDFSDGYGSAIVTGKGSKDRRVYFSPEAVTAFRGYLSERKARFPASMPGGGSPVSEVFVNQKGTPLSPHGIWFIVSRYSGVEGTNRPVSPHAFRHTFATGLLGEGADIRVVQEMLGHSSISTTQRYTHVTAERLKAVYDQAFPHSGKDD